MAVWYANSHDNEPEEIKDWLFSEVAKTRNCFLCYGLLTFPLVEWFGSGGYIMLHERCAASFVRRLQQDVEQLVEHRVDGKIDEKGSLYD